VSDYNVERAIELYFESGGMDLSGPPPSHPPPAPPQQQAPGPQIIDVDDMSDIVETGSPSPDPNIEDDEAFARRLMQEDVDFHGPVTDNDGIRSPIAARNDILVHPDEDYDYVPRGLARRGARGSSYSSDGNVGGSSSRGIFNQAAPSIWNADDPLQSLAESTGGSSEASDKASRLAQMYRRPFEIMHNVTLDQVRLSCHC
jgi:UBX domain-containing protein 7